MIMADIHAVHPFLDVHGRRYRPSPRPLPGRAGPDSRPLMTCPVYCSRVSLACLANSSVGTVHKVHPNSPRFFPLPHDVPKGLHGHGDPCRCVWVSMSARWVKEVGAWRKILPLRFLKSSSSHEPMKTSCFSSDFS